MVKTVVWCLVATALLSILLFPAVAHQSTGLWEAPGHPGYANADNGGGPPPHAASNGNSGGGGGGPPDHANSGHDDDAGDDASSDADDGENGDATQRDQDRSNHHGPPDRARSNSRSMDSSRQNSRDRGPPDHAQSRRNHQQQQNEPETPTTTPTPTPAPTTTPAGATTQTPTSTPTPTPAADDGENDDDGDGGLLSSLFGSDETPTPEATSTPTPSGTPTATPAPGGQSEPPGQVTESSPFTETEEEWSGMSVAENRSTDIGPLRITAASVPADWVHPGYNVSVQATFANTAGHNVTETMPITFAGEDVATREVTVPGGEQITRTFEVTFMDAGDGVVLIAGVEAGELQVVSGSQANTADGAADAQGGFGGLVAVVAFLALALYARRLDRRSR